MPWQVASQNCSWNQVRCSSKTDQNRQEEGLGAVVGMLTEEFYILRGGNLRNESIVEGVLR
jgi:hypothetical protein